MIYALRMAAHTYPFFFHLLLYSEKKINIGYCGYCARFASDVANFTIEQLFKRSFISYVHDNNAVG